MSSHLSRLRCVARSEVQATVRSLPDHVRVHAAQLPVAFESVPNEAIVEDGFEPDLLGLFVGKAFNEEESGGIDVPPQILLFLDNIWDYAEGDDAVFREEVRTTYLHELGHYLGLDELDLEERGLE
jgi:predicted Zn-dependent protease with MMP-like domain